MGSDNTTSAVGRVTKPITGYRDWVMAQSRKMRALLFVGLLALFMAAGLGFGALPTGNILTQIVAWVVLLFLLYSLYALVRSVVANVRA